jgi:hypothetical protein
VNKITPTVINILNNERPRFRIELAKNTATKMAIPRP